MNKSPQTIKYQNLERRFEDGIWASCDAEAPATDTIISEVKQGLPIKRFNELRSEFNISTDRMAEIVGIPRSTLIRRKKAGFLDQAESERVVRFDRLLTIATQVFEDKEAARTWLNEPARALGGKKPMNYADTEIGAREVEMLLGRIEHGVFT